MSLFVFKPERKVHHTCVISYSARMWRMFALNYSEIVILWVKRFYIVRGS